VRYAPELRPVPAAYFTGGVRAAAHNARHRKTRAAMLNRLTETLNFQSEALTLRSERQRVLASNIANADTPGYQARDMNFAQALREATGQGRDVTVSSTGGVATGGPLRLSTTATGHMDAAASRLDSTLSTARLAYAQPAQTNLDANSVDMDRERAAFADNSVKYEATLRFINGSVRTMLDAIKGQ
jgi:flagellar basal-body rod protein FlgB